MRIVPDLMNSVATGLDRWVSVEHGEGSARRSLTFPISLYKKTYFTEEKEIFKPINNYWASLPEEDQAAIYAIYEDVRELFDTPGGSTTLRAELTDLTTRLMAFHKTKDVIAWIRRDSGMIIPASVTQSYKHDVDRSTTVDQTYVYEDYLGLMALSVVLRAMIPIWAMYSKPAKDATGKVHKERVSFLLLRDSEIYNSEPIQRLRRYIKANISKDSYTGNHTLEFIPSDDLPDYLMSIVCVRKLCLGSLYITNKDAQNLAAAVYTYIIDRPGPQGSDYTQTVREKKIKKEGAGETTENSSSNIEIYKARASITPGRVSELEYDLRDPFMTCLNLCPGTDEVALRRNIDRALETSLTMLSGDIQNPQVTLAQYVLGPIFAPQALYYISQDSNLMVQACAITQTVLQHRGFDYLAVLSTSVAMIDEVGMRVTPAGSKSQLPDDLVENFEKHFPYKRISKKRAVNQVPYCFVTEDIRRLVADFHRFTWRATADEDLVRKALDTRVRRVTILPSLRTEITKMLVDSEELFS